ncbi:hypothetical protein ZOSMA_562G00030 [Zostera marina]|uniref:Uncharacterized protein n=1 Tax=Zostera marina TaxID=29655 RepID=A0A0K9NVZ7_ZOSMR|nr:hypothetical protein ZOSMA_562G00030 [Zostera marina]
MASLPSRPPPEQPPAHQQKQPQSQDVKMGESPKKNSAVEGNEPVTGHIISTTIGGKNGEPKQK